MSVYRMMPYEMHGDPIGEFREFNPKEKSLNR
jgi:hypothetical protein